MFAGDLIHVVANRSFQAHNTEYTDIHTQTHGKEMPHSYTPPIHTHFPSQSTCNLNRFEYTHVHANKRNPLDSTHFYLQSQKSPLQLSLATECSLA